jgi:Uma2 family endonuclease
VVWEEDGRNPDVIVEFLSDSTASQDRELKKDLYKQTFRTQDYCIYDGFHRLRVSYNPISETTPIGSTVQLPVSRLLSQGRNPSQLG